MNISYSLLNTPYLLKDGELLFLVIENLEEYRKILYSYYTKNLIINLYKNNEIIDNFLFIQDLIDIDFNSTKIKNKIYKLFNEELNNEFNYVDIENINNQIINILNKVAIDLNLDIELNDKFDITQLLKSYDLKINYEDTNILEKLITYCDFMSEIFKFDYIIFKGLSELLNEEEIILLENHIKLRLMTCISLENTERESIKNCKKIIIDKDLCLIYN